jgi:hypothetical protein
MTIRREAILASRLCVIVRRADRVPVTTSLKDTFTLELSYPAARQVDQTDDYFGTTVSDPYRWMEDVDSPELKAWIDAENELTQRYLAQIPLRKTMQRRLTELINFERYTPPARRGARYFYSHNSGLQNQNVVYWQEGLDGEPKVLLDPNTFSEDGTVAISGISITDDGLLAAYSIADAGSDWVKWHVRNVTTGGDLPDLVEWSKFSGASWLKDGSGFFYQGYDAPEADAFKSANYFHKVMFHKLGTPQSEDKLVFDRPDDKELNLGAHVTDDGRYLLLHQSKGTSPNNELAVKDLQDPNAPILRLIDTADATYAAIDALLAADDTRRAERQGDLDRPEQAGTRALEDGGSGERQQAERYFDRRQYVHRELSGGRAGPGGAAAAGRQLDRTARSARDRHGVWLQRQARGHRDLLPVQQLHHTGHDLPAGYEDTHVHDLPPAEVALRP